MPENTIFANKKLSIMTFGIMTLGSIGLTGRLSKAPECHCAECDIINLI